MLNEKAKLVYENAIPVRWYDMDAFAHVNTSVYFTYFEQTRISWFIEIAPSHYRTHDTGPVVVNASCTFLKPIVYPEIILVKLFIAPPGRSSFETFYEIRSQKNLDQLYAQGSAKIVWVDRKTGHSIPLPEELLKFLPNKE
ncbi:MAG: acyl-CoA thioesterase [Gammaproteobacteria bacterium]